MLPDRLRTRIEAALEQATGAVTRLKHEGAVGGGCISNATRLLTDAGDRYFLKWGTFAPGLFAGEAHGLAELQSARAVRVPAVIAFEDEAQNEFNWLLLEWLEPGTVGPRAWQDLARALAALHRQTRDRFGWIEANFIGSLPQQNDWSHDWPAFWRDARIHPQLEMASRSGALNSRERRRIEAVLAKVSELAVAGNEDGPSLLHGDLWGGNVHATASGEAALIDPSVYYGHREVDLAMAALFGGFTRDFFDAYHDAWPLRDGAEQRRLLYQMYYLLVHVNLFGGSYVSSTMSVVGRLGF